MPEHRLMRVLQGTLLGCEWDFGAPGETEGTVKQISPVKLFRDHHDPVWWLRYERAVAIAARKTMRELREKASR